jgi:hypothetical protein
MSAKILPVIFGLKCVHLLIKKYPIIVRCCFGVDFVNQYRLTFVDKKILKGNNSL